MQAVKKQAQPAYVLYFKHTSDARLLPFNSHVELVQVSASGSAPARKSLNITKLMREHEDIKKAVWRRMKTEDPRLAAMLQDQMPALQALAEAFNGQIIVKAEWL